MAKMHALPLATTAQQEVTRFDSGLRSSAPGVFGAARPSSDLWVDFTGDDTNGDGSSGNPFRTLTRAFTFITANVSAYGYSVHLPAGLWEENVGLPPPKTRIIGAGSTQTHLTGVGVPLNWTEGPSDAKELYFKDVRLTANITGRDGGFFSLFFERVFLTGRLQLIGSVEFFACEGADTYSDLVNCSNVRVRSPILEGGLTVFDLSYDPNAGTNGSGAVLNEVDGGAWGVIQYTSTDATVPLLINQAQVATVQARTSASIEVIGSKVGALQTDSASCTINYDGLTGPTYNGLGTFNSKELLIRATIPANFDSGDITIPIPKQGTSTLKNVFFSADLAGPSFSWVSSTNTSITVHVLGTSSTHPAYELRVLVKL